MSDVSGQDTRGTRTGRRVRYARKPMRRWEGLDLRGEHLAQDRQDSVGGGVIDGAEPLHPAGFVHRSDLIQHHLPRLSPEPGKEPGWVGAALGRSWAGALRA